MTPDPPAQGWVMHTRSSVRYVSGGRTITTTTETPVRTIAIMQHLKTEVGHEHVEMQQQFRNNATARQVIMSAQSVTMEPWRVSAYRIVAPETDATPWLTESEFTRKMNELLGNPVEFDNDL